MVEKKRLPERPLTVRKVQIEDLKGVLEIENLSFKNPYSFELFLYYYEKNRDGFFVAEENKEIMGYSIASLKGEIISLAVLPKNRNKKIGSDLLSKSISFMKERAKAKEVKVHVRTSNKGAIKFYLFHGFEKKKLVKNYYPGEDAYFMTKPLD